MVGVKKTRAGGGDYISLVQKGWAVWLVRFCSGCDLWLGKCGKLNYLHVFVRLTPNPSSYKNCQI